MTTGVKLAGFALVLAVATGAGAVMGAAFGPSPAGGGGGATTVPVHTTISTQMSGR